jgi:hypothetical protein
MYDEIQKEYLLMLFQGALRLLPMDYGLPMG